MFRLMRRQMTLWAEPLMALRREEGVEGTGDILTDKFSTDLVLAMFPPAFGAPHATGLQAPCRPGFPISRRRPLRRRRPGSTPFLAGAPPVVFTLGTTAVHIGRDFYTLAAEAAQALGRRAILLMGKNPPPDAPADQILALDYAPHASIFPHAAAVVHHGGVGGCAEVIRAGVPALTIPFAFDQPDNAMRMKRMGVGEVLPLKKVTRATLERSLKAVLDDTAMAARARAVAREIDPAADMART